MNVPDKGHGSYVKKEGTRVPPVLIGLTITTRTQGTRCEVNVTHPPNGGIYQVRVAQILIC